MGRLTESHPAGKCRFCNRQLPVEHVQLETPDGVFSYPVMQCDYIARNVAGAAYEMSDRWAGEIKAKKVQSSKKAKHWEL